MRRLPLFRFLLLGLVILAGVALFLTLSPRAAPLVKPTGMEVIP